MSDTRKILIADDSRVAAHLLGEIIESIEGCEIVDNATSGEQAIEYYDKYMPDLVTMDLSMPGIGGMEAVRRIIEKHPDAKIVVVSSLGGAQDKLLEALEAGALSVVSKPFDEDKAISVFKKLLGLK
ncbi:MAG TPA: response regulator [bacterium]|nr:response regulator [bacterium]HPI77347.1 response regulator [bacterium]HPN95996.1 response regulator [bacterium]